MKTYCDQCGCEFIANGKRGRTPKFCSNACRQRAYRQRRCLKPVLPAVMSTTRRWVRATHKRPITPTGLPASSTNPSTWFSFRDVQKGAGDGFGFMLGDGVGCYDLDHCFTGGVLDEWAREFVSGISLPVLCVERSVSGDGLHVFVGVGECPGRRFRFRGGSVEFYSRARFVRMTCDFLTGGREIGAWSCS